MLDGTNLKLTRTMATRNAAIDPNEMLKGVRWEHVLFMGRAPLSAFLRHLRKQYLVAVVDL